MPTDPAPREQYDDARYPHQRVTGVVIASAFAVHRAFGFGFLEAVYRRAMAVELRYLGVDVQQETSFPLHYRGECVGNYRADLIVANCVIVEVKAGPRLDPTARAQLLNYLSCSGLELGLIVHFGPSVDIKRIVATRPPPLQRPSAPSA